MDINRGNLTALFTAYNQAFKNGLKLNPVEYEYFVTTLPAATKVIEFPFLEQLSGMREWVGPRQKKNLASKKLTVTVRTFEDTIGVSADDVRDDQYGLYTPLVANMGQASANLPGELSFAALIANANWLDAVAFFSTAGRSYDGTNAINNYGTAALTATTYATNRALMMSYLGHGGKPLNIVPDTLVFGPKLESTARAILESDVAATTGLTGESTYVYGVTTSNPWKGTAKVKISTQLVGTYDDYWYLACTTGPVKPVIFIDRESPTFAVRDQPTDDNVFFDNEILYGSKRRGEAALAYPHLIFANVL
jgi:phage major head subunit gpT-like protein